MSEDMIVRHCAPTLAGLKTGNIFTVDYRNKRELNEELCRMNSLLNEKGVQMICLRARNRRALIYTYRPGKLKRDLADKEAKKILLESGYWEEHRESRVRKLKERIQECEGFPHEIGLFLGYPPEDVRGFIECCGKQYKICGYWKVYGDQRKAEKQFASFAKCTLTYMKCLQQGSNLQKLTVRASLCEKAEEKTQSGEAFNIEGGNDGTV